MEKPTVRSGIIGSGFAAAFHFNAIQRVYGVRSELLGVYSPNQTHAKAFANNRKIKRWNDLDSLIDDADVVLRLIVDDDGASCRPTDLAPDWTSDAGTALRVLFGPLDPLDVVALPTAAVALRSWCPLPLGLSYLDHV